MELSTGLPLMEFRNVAKPGVTAPAADGMMSDATGGFREH